MQTATWFGDGVGMRTLQCIRHLGRHKGSGINPGDRCNLVLSDDTGLMKNVYLTSVEFRIPTISAAPGLPSAGSSWCEGCHTEQKACYNRSDFHFSTGLFIEYENGFRHHHDPVLLPSQPTRMKSTWNIPTSATLRCTVEYDTRGTSIRHRCQFNRVSFL